MIQAFRVRGITDRFLFVALDETTEGLRSTCREALGVDTNFNFEHKLEFAKISKAWSSAKIASETKEKLMRFIVLMANLFKCWRAIG